MNLGVALILGGIVLALHMLAVTMGRALRTYSRSRLEQVCQLRGRAERADAIYHLDERTERGTEAIEVITGLALAALLGALAAWKSSQITAELIIFLSLAVGALGHVSAGVMGRVHAEFLLDACWPAADLMRRLTAPLILVSRGAEALAYRTARRSTPLPRPASVEVEVHSTSDPEENVEAELPDSIRDMLERVIHFSQADVGEIMTPQSSTVFLPADICPREATRAFIDSGFSRIPLYGESRDDIVGVLYAKDLWAQMVNADDPDAVVPRLVARPAKSMPETKGAFELLDEFRSQRVQMAIVYDERGGVVGLITLEDLLEQVVGPIDDEFDPPQPADPLVKLDDGLYEIDGTLGIEDLNDRLGLHLSTEGDFETLGGLAFQELGRVPEPGVTFRYGGLEFLVLEVAGHSIRRLRLNLMPTPPASVHGPAAG